MHAQHNHTRDRVLYPPLLLKNASGHPNEEQPMKKDLDLRN